MSSTSSPNVYPTVAPSYVEITNSSTLVLGMGVGTFMIIFMAFALSFVWCVSIGCDFTAKLVSRIVSTSIFGIIVLVLIFSPREGEYEIIGSSSSPNYVYDTSIIPRIAVTGVVIIFGILAGLIMIGESSHLHQLSTMQYDEVALWQDE